MGGSGVQRPVKFAKYLQRYGWEPIVVAPDPGIYHTFDESLNKELADANVRVERVQNSALLKAGKKSINPSHSKPWKAALLKWITSWFFLPDNKKGWINDAVRKCVQLTESESISALFATAPPYSNLIVAQRVKAKTGLPVIMDLRDDWLDSHLISYPTRWHYNKMKRLESDTLKTSDHITVVNSYYKSKIKDRLGKNSPAITVIPNGFDRETFASHNSAGKDNEFVILYSGLFYGSRKPDWFLKSVKKVIEKHDDFSKHVQLWFQGGLNQSHWKTINDLGLRGCVTDFGYLEHHNAVANVMKADVLFLTLGDRKHIEAVTPGKVFEYMGSLKPILAYIPTGVTHSLLNKYGAASCVGITDVDAGADAILKLYEQWKTNNLPTGSFEFIQSFDRLNLTEQLSGVLDRVTEEI